MDNPLLILDVSNLAWVGHHAIGPLSYKSKPTEVLFTLFRDILVLQRRFSTSKIAFAFDYGTQKRCEVYPEYKSNRREKYENQEPKERVRTNNVQKQINLLKTSLLSKLGYQNIFSEKGYEADDIIASICKRSLKDGETAIIVSSDKDLYQLLRSNIMIVQPQQNKLITKRIFSALHEDILPRHWPIVKGLMGDPGDGVPGVPGIGVKRAIKYIKASASEEIFKQKEWKLDGPNNVFLFHSPYQIKLHKAVCEFVNNGFLERNLKLVKLPFLGCPTFKIKRDKVSRKAWRKMMKSFGITSLIREYPNIE